jgi:hypothetical protein
MLHAAQPRPLTAADKAEYTSLPTAVKEWAQRRPQLMQLSFAAQELCHGLLHSHGLLSHPAL